MRERGIATMVPRRSRPASGSTKARAVVAATSVLLQTILALAVLVAIAPRASAYATHAPIRIDGDSGFTPANGVTRGSGTPADPYIIEGWEINASMSNGIDVRNVDASFIVQGNRIHSGGRDLAGVYVLQAGRASIQDNVISNNEFGIRADNSRAIAIT